MPPARYLTCALPLPLPTPTYTTCPLPAPSCLPCLPTLLPAQWREWAWRRRRGIWDWDVALRITLPLLVIRGCALLPVTTACPPCSHVFALYLTCAGVPLFYAARHPWLPALPYVLTVTLLHALQCPFTLYLLLPSQLVTFPHLPS